MTETHIYPAPKIPPERKDLQLVITLGDKERGLSEDEREGEGEFKSYNTYVHTYLWGCWVLEEHPLILPKGERFFLLV